MMSFSTFIKSSLIILLAVIYCTDSLGYGDLTLTGKYCPSRDKCDDSRMRQLTYMDRNCECDTECASYNDCCIDVVGRPRRRKQAARENVKCVPYGNRPYAGVYMISDCRKNWNGSSELRDKCLGPAKFFDPFSAAPVTDTAQNRTYRNNYCARCNDADFGSLKAHHTQLRCEGLQDVREEQILDDLIYVNGTWGVYRHTSDGNTFIACSVVFDVPGYLNGSVRFCRPDMVSTCGPKWASRRIKRYCEEYMAAVYDGRNVAYRNPHCAICNYKSAKSLFCTPGENRPSSFGPSPSPIPDSSDPSEGDEVRNITEEKGFPDLGRIPFMELYPTESPAVFERPPPTPSCPPNRMYDPFSKRCRRTTCPLPGYVVVNGRCTNKAKRN